MCTIAEWAKVKFTDLLGVRKAHESLCVRQAFIEGAVGGGH